MGYQTVIGVETHVELRTSSKMFCPCPAVFGATPNSNVCPVCLGLPGALPVPNERAIEMTLALGLALDCRVAEHSVFHRKNYFYADLPKNYQISQYDLPFCIEGHLDLELDGGVRQVGIMRVHLEEDTGKIVHVGEGGRITSADYALIDFNRSGIPLVEVVSDPDLRSPEEARAYATELRALLLAIGVSDARLEEGSLRFDANISLRPEEQEELGTKVEVKNMNSTRSLQRALAFEVDRQRRLLDSGRPVVQETRHWDEEAQVTRPGRTKEEASDYRYFSEPDLLPMEVSRQWRDHVAASLPVLPAQQRAGYRRLGVNARAIAALSATEGLGGLLERAVEVGADAGVVANWLTGEVVAYLRREDLGLVDLPLTGEDLAELAGMWGRGELSATAAKEVLGAVMAGDGRPREVAERRDLLQVSDLAALGPQVEEVLAAHPRELERLRAGEQRLVGFFVGEVMKATRGKADPKLVSQLIREEVS
ncbi:MAG: Asp-tRNA(Asn)/Glu-tRNA(Gln) amidotransferase subunit GatB [Actinomycetota bacterium]|nr:Asp-tRNA(Asn)/Glu-tRNA(Gln) amidotransferase subunit GatB [Actinomycetota bacterium]